MEHSYHALVSFRSFPKFKAESWHISAVPELYYKVNLNRVVYVLHYVQLFVKPVEDCKEFCLVFPLLSDLKTGLFINTYFHVMNVFSELIIQHHQQKKHLQCFLLITLTIGVEKCNIFLKLISHLPLKVEQWLKLIFNKTVKEENLFFKMRYLVI